MQKVTQCNLCLEPIGYILYFCRQCVAKGRDMRFLEHEIHRYPRSGASRLAFDRQCDAVIGGFFCIRVRGRAFRMSQNRLLMFCPCYSAKRQILDRLLSLRETVRQIEIEARGMIETIVPSPRSNREWRRRVQFYLAAILVSAAASDNLRSHVSGDSGESAMNFAKRQRSSRRGCRMRSVDFLYDAYAAIYIEKRQSFQTA